MLASYMLLTLAVCFSSCWVSVSAMSYVAVVLAENPRLSVTLTVAVTSPAVVTASLVTGLVELVVVAPLIVSS